jgi:hypothetical protein
MTHRTLHSASLSSLLALSAAMSFSSIFATTLGSNFANASLNQKFGAGFVNLFLIHEGYRPCILSRY